MGCSAGMEDVKLILTPNPVQYKPPGRQGQVTYLDAGSVRPPRTNAPLCSLFTNTHTYTHTDIFPLMIGFITCFLLGLESSRILLQSREPCSLLWEEALNVTTASR